MPQNNRLQVYADAELGAYGYHEKPWYLPGQRLEAFLAELENQGLTDSVDFRSAGPAADDDLCLFHTAAHLRSVRERCATNAGSLDSALPPVLDDAKRLLQLVAEVPAGRPVADVRQELSASLVPAMTLDDYLPYLASEGLLELADETVAITEAGQTFLGDEAPWLNGPTYARAHVERAATFVAGAAIDATRRIIAGDFASAFIPIAGYHHAHADQARLYCLYNDPALAVSCALSQLNGNVAYIDIDIHQGDGVYEGFADNPRVWIADLHEDPGTLFPFTVESPGQGHFDGRRDATGRGSAVGTKLNIPLAPHTTDAKYLEMWAEAEDFVRAAKPEFIVFEAGVDGLETDPMSNQRISRDAIAQVASRVAALAKEVAGGRVLVLGGGGYELTSVSKGWVAVVRALLAA